MKDKLANKSIVTKKQDIPIHRFVYEQHVIKFILASLVEFQERDSRWALSRILNLTINVNKLNPLRAECHIEVPRE